MKAHTQYKVSVIIPCYNMGLFIGDTINSIESNSSYEGLLEVIIVNDGSTDKTTLETLSDLEERGYFVHHQENKGLSAARNAGIEMSTGDLIVPLDADNKLTPTALNTYVQAFRDKPEADIVYGDAIFFGEKEGAWEVGPFDFSKLVCTNYIDACACFRKSVWQLSLIHI